jgi:hypothetical protein
MEIAVGYDGYCRSDAWCPVYVVLANEGTDMEGELRAAVQSSSGAEPSVYSRSVALPAHSRKAYFLYLPAAELLYRPRLTVQLAAANEALAIEEVVVTWVDATDRLYGIVSSDTSALNFLADVAPAGGEARVARLALDALPPDPLAWEGLDVLILNDVDTAALDDEQRRALETWLAHGGHLVVGGGAGAARTAAGVAGPSIGSGQRLLPVTVTGVRQVDDLRALGEVVGAPVAAGPFAVAETDLQDGEALIEQDGLVLLARRSHGAGQVDFLAFDAGLNPFASWDDNIRLWKWIVEAQPTVASLPGVSGGYPAQQAVNAIPGLRGLSALEILAFMLIYIVIIGPLNYLVLRRLKRRELAWLTIPLVVAGFTVCAYVTGFRIRGSATIVHRLGLVVVPQESRVGRVSEVVGLFSPRRTRYDVRAAGARVREIPAGDYYGGPMAVQPLHIVEEEDGSTVTDLRVDVGGVQPFLVEGYVDVPPVEADLRLVGDTANRLHLQGTLQSGELSLRDAVLIAGDSEQRLGDVTAGERVQVDLAFGPTPGSAAGLPERIVGPGDYWQDRELYRRYQFLQACFPYGVSASLPQGVFLMGWAEENVPLPVEVVGWSSTTIAMALYIYELPVVGLEAGTGAAIPPAFITRRVESSTGYVSAADGGPFRMESGSEIAFRFTVWPGVMVSRVDELTLELQGSSYGGVADPPMVSLWDWESNAWKEQGMDWGLYSVPNAGRYVSSIGQVLVRLETSSGAAVEVQSLAISIRGQR